MRLPNHIGVIPDGNRRWAQGQGLTKDKGYDLGIDPGLQLFKLCQKAGIQELTMYGFTTDNTKRPVEQRKAFTEACIRAVNLISGEDCEILVLGNTKSPMFPKELLPYTQRTVFGKGGMKVNFLVNYSWKHDLESLKNGEKGTSVLAEYLESKDVSRLDLIIRWGGRRRLSGFLPIQAVYADFYVIDDLWPDFRENHFYDALNWYGEQDITLGG